MKSNRFKRARTHTDELVDWFRNEIAKKENVSRELSSLARGPNRAAKRYSGYVVNGYRFHSKKRDNICTTQNSGVYLTALTTSFASSKDQKSTVGDVHYYGSIEEIIEVDYWGASSFVLFRCTWYVADKDSLGFTRVNFNKICHKNDPFVMSTQAHQLFYIQDPVEKQFYYPVKRLSAEFYDPYDDKHDINASDDDINGQFTHETSGYHSLIENEDGEDEGSWSRADVPTREFVAEETTLIVSNYLI